MYTAKEIGLHLLGESFLTHAQQDIQHLLTDSRKLGAINAKKTLFFAIQGERLDGHLYIDDLYQKGVRNFVIEKQEKVAKYKDINYFKVDDSLKAMQYLASFHRNHFSIPVIGITGSNGKTIIKEWLHQLLHDDLTVCRSPLSYNSQLGVPLSVWQLNHHHEIALFEAGISEPNEMGNLQKVIQPTIGIFTNIGSAHQIKFKNDIEKINEKLKLFEEAEVLIYNADQTIVKQQIQSRFKQSKVQLISWGKAADVDYKICAIQTIDNITQIQIQHQDEISNFSIPFNDSGSIQNAIHCIVTLLYLNFSIEKINVKLQNLQRVAMRLEQKKGINNTTIINDSYNADFDSLKMAVEYLSLQQTNLPKTVILSSILQSGIPENELYQSVNEVLLANNISRFIGIGKALIDNKACFKEEDYSKGTAFYPNTTSFLSTVSTNSFANEFILLKGARSFQFENINDVLQQQAHTTRLEINMNHIIHNLNYFHSFLSPNTKMMVMVKAFSYGVSSIEIAKLLAFHQVDYLGVAYTDEGVKLRKGGIATPIFILNPEENSFSQILQYQLEPEMYSFDLLDAFIEFLVQKDIKNYPIHINIDTGMKRLGFEENEIELLIDKIKQSDAIKIASIYSHLAAADDEKEDEFSLQQIESFKRLSLQIIENIGYQPILHIANSHGIIRFKQAHFEMVRLGIGLYGFSEGAMKQLLPVSSLKSTISQIKTVQKGESIGYGRKTKAETNKIIGTIAIGYADGLNRRLSRGVGEVYVRGQRAPIIGNICMDMTMIDLTNANNVKVGDEVEIFGEHITILELARKLETIPYEILTSISERVKRVFFIE